MYDNYRNPHPPGIQIPPPNPQPGPYDNPLYGASSGLIKTGLGVYGEKFLGSSSEFMHSNISRYFSNPQYYFHVNDQYVRNKLKVILFMFLHRGHWTRISEPVGGRMSYKPSMYDINAPDLDIPFMAFGTFIILAGFTLGFMGKFTPESHKPSVHKRNDWMGPTNRRLEDGLEFGIDCCFIQYSILMKSHIIGTSMISGFKLYKCFSSGRFGIDKFCTS